MGLHRFVYDNPAEAAVHCSHHVVARVEEALSGQEFATFAISGGASPKALYAQLAGSELDWSRVHLFWVDERCVPPADAQSNYGMAERELIGPARIPRKNVHRVHGEMRPDDAARRYVDEIRSVFALGPGEMPHFDLIHYGIGADGHTASLFPGEALIEDRERIAAAVFAEKMTQWRVTLLPGALLSARHAVVFATGGDKAETIRSIFEDPYEPMRLPAQLPTHHSRAMAWFLDRAAAGRLG